MNGTMEDRQDRALDALLDRFTVEPPAADLASRIVARAMAAPQEPARRGLSFAGWTLPALLPRAAWLAASMAVGLWLGANGVLQASTDQGSADIFVLAQDSLDPGVANQW